MSKLQDRPELVEIRALAQDYAHNKRVQKGVDLWTFCDFCKIRIKSDFVESHKLTCKKRPDIKKLPLEVAVRYK